MEVNTMAQPLCPWERALVPILLKAGWELGPVYMCVETNSLGTTKLEPRTVQNVAIPY